MLKQILLPEWREYTLGRHLPAKRIRVDMLFANARTRELLQRGYPERSWDFLTRVVNLKRTGYVDFVYEAVAEIIWNAGDSNQNH